MTSQKAPPSRPNSARLSGALTFRLPSGAFGSLTKSTSTATAAKAGSTATQKTVWKLLKVMYITRIASPGPSTPPTVSSACRKP